MNSLFQHHPKRSSRRALGTLLLALPLSGIALQLPSAQAQPAPTLPAKKNPKPLSPDQKTALDKVLAITHQENLCKSIIDLKVENATLDDVTTRIKAMLPGQTIAIEVRGANLVHVGFDLKGAKVGDTLDHVAALAGCRLFVFSRGLLIAPTALLTEAELSDIKQWRGGEWAKDLEAGGTGWYIGREANQLFARAIAQEATGSDAKPFPAGVVKTTFGNFSPDSQAILQQMATDIREHRRSVDPGAPPFHLSPDSPIAVDTSNPTAISISFDSGASVDQGSMVSQINLR